MAVVQGKNGGREYQIGGGNGQEKKLQQLAGDVDDRVSSLIFQMGGNPGEAMILLLTNLMMADEIIENKKEMEKIAEEVKQFRRLVDEERAVSAPDQRLADMEAAMVITLEEIALRIEKITAQVEVN